MTLNHVVHTIVTGRTTSDLTSRSLNRTTTRQFYNRMMTHQIRCKVSDEVLPRLDISDVLVNGV